MDQRSFFDFPGVDTIRSNVPVPEPERSIARAEAGAGEAWMRLALAAIELVARHQDTLTTDDIWSRIGAPPEPRAMGAVMRLAARQDLIVATSTTIKSAREECHHRDIRVWKSLVFE